VKKDTWRFSIDQSVGWDLNIGVTVFKTSYLPTYLPTRRNSFAIFFDPPGAPTWLIFPTPRGLLFQPMPHCQPRVVRSDRRVSHPYGCKIAADWCHSATVWLSNYLAWDGRHPTSIRRQLVDPVVMVGANRTGILLSFLFVLLLLRGWRFWV